MIFRLPERPAAGIALHALLICCGIQFFLMVLACFGCVKFPFMTDTLPAKILTCIVFVCWCIFYLVCCRRFLVLYFCRIELYESYLTLTRKGFVITYDLTDKTAFDGLQLKGLETGGKPASLALNYLVTGADNLEKLIALLDRRSNRMPFQF